MNQSVPNFAVYKYELEWRDEQTLRIPAGGRPLSVALQNDKPVIYFHVDKDKESLSTYLVRIAGTGHPLNTKTCVWGPNEFIGTLVHRRALYFHVFAKYV